MNRQDGYEEKREAAKKFETEYEVLLGNLAAMPHTNKEEREQRWNWFHTRKEYDRFYLELAIVYKPGAYNKLLKRYALDDKGNLNNNLHLQNDFDIISLSSPKGGMDFMVFTEALKETVGEYTGQNMKGEHVGFVAQIGRKYRQHVEKALAKDASTREGMVSGSSERSQINVGRLIKKIGDLKRQLNDERDLEELTQMVVQQSLYHFTKKEIEDARILLEKLNFVYINETSEDNLDSNQKTQPMMDIEDESWRDQYEGLEKDEAFSAFLSQFAGNIETNWENIANITNKINRDILKAFLTKDILIELKLKKIPDEDMGTAVPEPKCRQWCLQSKRCRRKKSCRVRYDALQAKPPYGDGEIYVLLQPYGEELYHKLLHKNYLDTALLNNNFEDVYHNKLYPNPTVANSLEGEAACFDFSDGRLAASLHRDKGQISRFRKKYEEETREALWRMFSKESGSK